MRERFTVQRVPDDVAHCQLNASSASKTIGVWQEKRIEDVQTPDFSRLLKCGKFLPLNPTIITTRSETLVGRDDVDIRQTTNPALVCSGNTAVAIGRTWAGLTPSGQGSPQLPHGRWDWPEALRDDALVDLVVQTARANVFAERWDVLTFLGELGSTVRMFGELSGRFWKSMIQCANDGVAAAVRAERLRKRYAKMSRLERSKDRLSRAARRYTSASKWVQDNWLLARYGIRPLLYDMQDIVNTVNGILEDREANLVVGKARQTSSKRDTMQTTHGTPISGMTLGQVSWEESFSEVYRSQAYIELEGRWRELVHIDPLVTAWELTRLSFVFDWVCNIGAWLTGLTPQLRGDFAGTVVSIRASNVRSAIWTISPGPTGTGTAGTAYWEKRVEQYVRFPYNGIPYPRINLKLNPAKIMDLIALNRNGRSEFFKAMQRR